jgi:hypothetical protein
LNETVPLTRKILRAIFVGVAAFCIASVPLVILVDGDIRARLVNHDWSDRLFRELIFGMGEVLGLACILLILALVLGKTSVLGLLASLVANAGVLVAARGVHGKDLIVVGVLSVSLLCLLLEGCRTMLSLKRRAA